MINRMSQNNSTGSDDLESILALCEDLVEDSRTPATTAFQDEIILAKVERCMVKYDLRDKSPIPFAHELISKWLTFKIRLISKSFMLSPKFALESLMERMSRALAFLCGKGCKCVMKGMGTIRRIFYN